MVKKESYTEYTIKQLKAKAAAMEKAYNQEFELRHRLMQGMDKLREQNEALKKKNEELILRCVTLSINLRSTQASSDYFGKELFGVTKAMFERGARRAEVDEHYAVFRELLLSGQALTQENFLALVKANPNASIPGLVQVAEEFGMKISIDLVPREPIAKNYEAEFETIKNKDGTWKVEAKFSEPVVYVSKAKL